jgi:hypothetical protein
MLFLCITAGLQMHTARCEFYLSHLGDFMRCTYIHDRVGFLRCAC